MPGLRRQPRNDRVTDSSLTYYFCPRGTREAIAWASAHQEGIGPISARTSDAKAASSRIRTRAGRLVVGGVLEAERTCDLGAQGGVANWQESDEAIKISRIEKSGNSRQELWVGRGDVATVPTLRINAKLPSPSASSSGKTNDVTVRHQISDLTSVSRAMYERLSSAHGWRESRCSPVSAVKVPPTRMKVGTLGWIRASGLMIL
jgi:hypothetical protein